MTFNARNVVAKTTSLVIKAIISTNVLCVRFHEILSSRDA